MKNTKENNTVSVSTLISLLNQEEGAVRRYVDGFEDRIAAKEKELKEQAKTQQWSKANDDFEYLI